MKPPLSLVLIILSVFMATFLSNHPSAAHAGVMAAPKTPNVMNPPEACGIPLEGPYGKDLEVFNGPWGSQASPRKMDQAPIWGPGYILPSYTQPVSNIVAVPLGTDRIVAVWVESSKLRFDLWDASVNEGDVPGKWGVKEGFIPNPSATETPTGNPAVIPLGADSWEVYARFGNKIKYIDIVLDYGGGDPQLSPWFELTGVNNAASDPQVVIMGTNHTLVFYKDTDKHVTFQEWIGDVVPGGATNQEGERNLLADRTPVWREEPISLYTHYTFTYLPVAIHKPSTQQGYRRARADFTQGNGSIQPEIIASELSAISRSADHAAVFGVDAEGKLWVKEWTGANTTTWGDTVWQPLMSGIKIEKPAVVSININQLGVAVRRASDNGVYYLEWDLDTRLWKAAVPLNDTSASPLSMAATSNQSFSVFEVKNNTIYQKEWSEATPGHWSSWELRSSPLTDPNQTLATVVRRTNDLMLLGRIIYGQATTGFFIHYSSQGRPLAWSALDAPALKGYGRGQALPWVNGHVLWTDLHENQAGNGWQLSTSDLVANQAITQTLNTHPYNSTKLNIVSVARGDVDKNGSEELLVATHITGTTQTQLSLVHFVVTPTLSSAVLFTQTIAGSSGMEDVSMAVGDLDGDRVKNEVVVASIVPSLARIRLDVFKYYTTTHQLTSLVSGKYITYTAGITGTHELEVATGSIYSYADNCADKMLIALLDTARPSATQVSAEVRRFCLYYDTPSSSWKLDPGDLTQVDPYFHRTATVLAATPSGMYTSDVEAGDLDVDTYDEIVVSFADQVVKFDPKYYPASGLPRIKSFTLQSRLANPTFAERSLGVGDINQDGEAEIALAVPGDRLWILGATTSGELLQVINPTDLAPGQGTALVGDLDNDSYIAQLAGCITFHEPTVQVVINGAPRWYGADGKPAQNTSASWAQAISGGSGSEYGTTFKAGFGFTVGKKWKAPFQITDAEARVSAAFDFLWNLGQKGRTEKTDVFGEGITYNGNGLGLVVYSDSIYACYYFDLIQPAMPQYSTQMMTCYPVNAPTNGLYTLPIDAWNSQAWKDMTGAAWVDVGHKHPLTGEHTNDIGLPGNYTKNIPRYVDPQSLFFTAPRNVPNPFKIIVNPVPVGSQVQRTWYSEEINKTTTTQLKEFNFSLTLAGGFTWPGGISLDGRITGGYTNLDNALDITGDQVRIGGGVNMFDASLNRPCYQIVPYVYRATNVTQGGTTVRYWNADYFVPVDPWPCLISEEQ